MFDVIYEGRAFGGQRIHAEPISLLQAIQRHTLQPGLRDPVLRLALNNSGEVWGVVDITNRITYKTDADPSTATQVGGLNVGEVSYLSPDAPILKRPNNKDFKSAADLLAEARTALPYSPQRTEAGPSAQDSSLNNGMGESTATPRQSEAGSSSTGKPGPFGLERGMTKAQVMKLVGNSAIKENTDDYLELTSVPKGHPAFKHYILKFSPEAGLLKIAALSEPVESDAYGEQLKRKFEEIREALTNNYGNGKELDFLKSDSIWTEPRYWMMALTKNERTLVSYWEPKRNGISGVILECKGIDSDSGYLDLVYEFEGWGEYVDQVNRKKGSVF